MTHSYKLVCLTLLLCACYSPNYPEGRQCAPDASCPGDLVCDPNFFLCLSPENVGVVIPPNPPLPPEIPPDAYGWTCFDNSNCFEGMHCFIDFASGQEIGFCTAICGNGVGDINDEVCQYFDQGFGNTYCIFSDDPNNLAPQYCGTFCVEQMECPFDLRCQDNPFFGPVCTPQ